MKLLFITFLILSISCAAFSYDEEIVKEIAYQMEISDDVLERIGEIFEKFRDGYIEPNEALKKIHTLKNGYLKLARPVPPGAERLFRLMKTLLGRVENYFIYYKRTYRENPEINLKIAQTKYELSYEAYKLHKLVTSSGLVSQ